jgi:biopolymer transport protein ExbD
VPFQAPKQDSFDDDGDEGGGGLFAEINITPLTDVILVLLIIFMVSSSAIVDAMREGMIDVSLPSAATASDKAVAADALIVGITADGRLFVHGQAIDEDQLREVLEETKKKAPSTPIVVQADGSLQHRHVVEVIDMLRKSGFTNVGIAAEEDAK